MTGVLALSLGNAEPKQDECQGPDRRGPRRTARGRPGPSGDILTRARGRNPEKRRRIGGRDHLDAGTRAEWLIAPRAAARYNRDAGLTRARGRNQRRRPYSTDAEISFDKAR